MGAQACIYIQDPSSSYIVDVGSYVAVRMGMENCGDVGGIFYGEIFKNGSRCVGKWNEQLDPSGVLKFFGSECDIASMPNSTVNIKFCGGHAEGSVWHQDFVKYITLTPKAPPTICDQPVRVVDEDGVKIDNARVDCYEGASFKGHCTTYYGDCLLSFLDIGTQYKAVASKTGYECLNCEKYFIACTSTTFPGITLSLRKKPTTCNQSFIVKDTAGNTIYSNCIIVVREGGAWRNECATGTSGTCTVGLTEGKYLKACIEQVPSGYELIPESCKNFTACTSTITLKLYKTPTPYLNVTPLSRNSPVAGESFAITVESNVPWTAVDDQPWVSLSPTSGTGNGTITATVNENTETTSRTWHVTVAGDGLSLTRTYTQSGAVPTICSQQFALQDKDTYLYITGASVKVGGVECTEYPSIERYQIDNLAIGSSYNAIASKEGYGCPDTLCETTFTADPTNPAYNLYLKEIPTVDNYDIVFCVGKSIWGFDWIATNFVSKVLPKITSVLNSAGISGLVVHGEASYYDAEKKQIVVNADIPSHSPIAPLVLWLILTLVLPALIMLGVFIKETFFDKKGVEPATVTLRTIDTDNNVITEPISLTVNGVTKTTSEGVVSFAVNENFQVLCVSDTWDIFDSTKWYEPTTAMQDVVLSSTATRSVKILVTDEAGNPLPNTEVHVLDASGKYVRTATTDENGYVTLNMGAGEYTVIVINEQDIPTGTKKIGSGTEDLEEVIIVPEGYAMRVYARETGTSNYISGANITVDGKTGITDGKNGVLIADLEDKDYTVTAQHPSYNNGDIVTYPEVVNPTTVLEDVIIDMDHTGEDVLVRIYPRYETTNLVGAKVQLEGFAEKTTTQLGFVEYSNVPYGEYTVTATKQDFTQKEPSKKYPVDESHTIDGVVTIVVVMESELIPPPPPPKLSMMLIYGVATVGLYVAGMFVPKVGKVVQISAIIPGCLLIYEGYKYAKEKIPFLGTELEQLALPPKLTEPLRKKKLVIS